MEGFWWISYLKLRVWSELHLSEHTVQAEESYLPGSQAAEYTSAWVCVIFEQQKTLQIPTSAFSMAISCGVLFSWEEMWKVSLGGTEHLAWLSGSLPQSRDGESLRGEAMCHLSPCPVTLRQTKWELSSICTPAGHLPGEGPLLSVQQNQFDSWAEQSDWDYGHEGFSLLCHTWSELKDDGKEWMAIHSMSYCTSPLGGFSINTHKHHSVIQFCFLRHLPKPFIYPIKSIKTCENCSLEAFCSLMMGRSWQESEGCNQEGLVYVISAAVLGTSDLWIVS